MELANIFDYISQLYYNHLYDDVIQAIRFYYNNISQIKKIFGIVDGASILYYYGTSLYQVKEYRHAMHIFKTILTCYSDHFATFHNQINKNKTSVKRKSSSDDSLEDNAECVCTAIEVKYQIHLCYKKLGMHKSAVNILLSVPKESLTIAALISLGDLYIELNQIKEALDYYASAVCKNPFALFTLKRCFKYCSQTHAEELLRTVSQNLSDKLPPIESSPLLKLVKAHHYSQMPNTLTQSCRIYFDLRSPLTEDPHLGTGYLKENKKFSRRPENPYMLLETAKILYYEGYISNANYYFETVYETHQDLVEGIDCYAACLYRDDKKKQLQQLACKVIDSCTGTDSYIQTTVKTIEKDTKALMIWDSNNMLTRTEPWVVLGYYNLMKEDHKTSLFANKAFMINPKDEETLVLKSFIYGKRFGDTMNRDRGPNIHQQFINEVEGWFYKTKQKRSYMRFEILKHVAEAILFQDGRLNAENYVKSAIKQYGMNARIYAFFYMLTTMDSKSTSSDRTESVKMLEQAVHLNPFYLSAVAILAKEYIGRGKHELAFDMLQKANKKFDSILLDELVVECYLKCSNEEKALLHKSKTSKKSKFFVKKIKEDSLLDLLTEVDVHSVSFVNADNFLSPILHYDLNLDHEPPLSMESD